MISERTLGLAVERGLLSADQVEGLRAIEREAPAPALSEPADDEALRFITGFADIFVTIGIALFIGALGYILNGTIGSTYASGALAGAAWLLAEFFTRRRRMALPSIALLVVFAANVMAALAIVLDRFLPLGTTALPVDFWLLQATSGLVLILAGLGTVGAVALHYRRFQVPITIAAGVAALCIAAFGLVVSIVPDFSWPVFNGLILFFGLLVFALAMRFDLSDPARVTRRTDIAFWLHLLAAPMIVHPLIRGFFLDQAGPTRGAAMGILAVFLLLGIVAVVIDRRAILVSGLVYAGIAFGALIRTLGFQGSSLLIPTVVFVLGAFILLISAGWRPLRHAFLRLLPAALASRLPHPSGLSAS